MRGELLSALAFIAGLFAMVVFGMGLGFGRPLLMAAGVVLGGIAAMAWWKS